MAGLLGSPDNERRNRRLTRIGVGLLAPGTYGSFSASLHNVGRALLAGEAEDERMGLLRRRDARAQQMHDLGVSQMTAQAEQQRREMEGMGQVRAHLLMNPGDYRGAVQNADHLPVKTGMGLLAQASQISPQGFTLSDGQARYGADGNLIAERAKPTDYNQPFLPDGTPNEAYQQYRTNTAKAGATNVTVGGEKGNSKLTETLAGKVGNRIDDKITGAEAAGGTINTIHQLRAALDKGASTGLSAGPKRIFAQIANSLGLSGKDDAASLAAGREALQAMAQLKLDGAKQMRGQGQITEGERQLIADASSPAIERMTEAEIRAFLDALEKVARLQITSSNQYINRIGAADDPNMGMLRRGLLVDMPGEYQRPLLGSQRTGIDPSRMTRDQRSHRQAQIRAQHHNQQGAAAARPTVGAVVDGYRYRGGNPNDQSSWEPVR